MNMVAGAAQPQASNSSSSIILTVGTQQRQHTEQVITREDVLVRIEDIISGIVDSISKNEAPSLTHANRSSWNNVRFEASSGLEMKTGGALTAIKFDSMISVNKFALMLKVLSHIYHLVQTGTYCTKRNLFYQDPKSFGNQSYLDDLIDNISCMLRVPRWQLNVLATSKGCIAGNLQYMEVDGHFVDCRDTASGVLIPSHVHGIQNVYTDAKCVLVVEKDATFQRLLDDGICAKLSPCIVITGKGFPDVNTRLMVRRLWDQFKLPTLALVDADPHGIEILAVYKFGSRSLAFESPNLIVPSIRWLGVMPSDITRMQIPQTSLIPMTESDIGKAMDLLKRPYIASEPAWKTELELMLSSGLKAEIQCLQSLSPTFLADIYLPNKIQFGGWI